MNQISKEVHMRCEARIRELLEMLSGRLARDVISYSYEILDQRSEIGMVMEGVVKVVVDNEIFISESEKEIILSVFEAIGYLEESESEYFHEIKTDLDRISKRD